MRIDIPWGSGIVPVDIADGRVAAVLTARQSEAAPDLPQLMGAGLSDFRAFLSKAAPPLVAIVNDATRPTPSAEILALLRADLERWEAVAAKERRLGLLVATGTHRTPTAQEIDTIFGRDFAATHRRSIVTHDAWDETRLVHVGRTAVGTPVAVNTMLAEAKSVLVINSVEPHYFAGYTGGRKSVVPGAAAFETVRSNHKLAMYPASRDLALAGNPVHEDLTEAALLALAGKQVFSIQLVLDNLRRVCHVATGDLEGSLHAATPAADSQYVLDLEERADIVVSVASHPMDCDLYQTNKAIQSGAYALKDGGVLVVVSRCPFGIGHNRTFFDVLAAGPSPDAVIARTTEDYQLGLHQATRIARILQRAQIWAVTDLPDSDVEAVFFRPFHSVQAAVDAALAEMGLDAKVVFLLEASITVPRVRA